MILLELDLPALRALVSRARAVVSPTCGRSGIGRISRWISPAPMTSTSTAWHPSVPTMQCVIVSVFTPAG